MQYPCVEVITTTEQLYFFNQRKFKLTPSKEQVELFELHDDDVLIIFRCETKICKALVDYLKKITIKHAWIIIDDVLRSSIVVDSCTNELFAVESLLTQIKASNIRVFHCEKLPRSVTDNFTFRIEYFDLFLLQMSRNLSNFSSKYNNKFNFKISCLNNRVCIHRLMLLSKLWDCPNVFITINDYIDTKHEHYQLDYLYSNIDMKQKKQYIKKFKTLAKNQTQLTDKAFKQIKGFLPPEAQHSSYSVDYIKHSFMNVVTETTFEVNYPNISEKTLKPIAALRPFIIAGSQGSLQLLKDLGFKTFSEWWDESYDSVTDPHTRLKMIYSVVDKISQMSTKELVLLLDEMAPTLLHNKYHLDELQHRLSPLHL